MKKIRLILTAILTGVLFSAKAQFSGAFAPANWGTVAVNSDGTTNTGGAPGQIVMTSGDNNSGTSGTNDFTITIPQTGHITFSWTYSTNDGAQYDYPQYVVNSSVFNLNGYNTSGSSTQSGTQPCINVYQGDVFRLRMYTADNIAGAATTTFSSFSFNTGSISVTPQSPSICAGNTVALTASGASSYSWTGGISNGVPFTANNTTVHTVAAMISGCLNSQTVPVTVFPQLLVSPSAPMVCQGSSLTLGILNGNTYTWSTGPSNTSITVSPSSNTTYSVAGTTTNGCTSNVPVTVTVQTGVPALSVTSTSNSVCPGQSVTINASGANTYTFSGGISNGVAFSPPGTTTYVVTGGNACGTSTSAITVTVAPLPIFAIPSTSVVCASKPVTLTAGGAPNYTWEPGTNLTGNSVVVAPSVTTVYTVTGSDGFCSGTNTLVVNTNPNPTITVSASNSVICEGEVVTISASGANTYTWNPATISGNSGTVAPTVPELYTVQGTNSFGCIAATSQVVIVNASPTVNVVANPPSICAGSSATLTASGNGHSYLWSPSTQGSSLVVSPLVNTTYSVTGSFTTNNICTRTNTVTVNVFQATLSVNPASPTICAGEELILSAGHGSAYNWSTGQNTQTISVSPAAATMYTVSATTLSNNISCVAQNSVFVDVHPAAQVNAMASPTNICRGHTTTLTANGTSSYKWTGPMNSTQSSFTWSTNLATTFTFVVTGTDENGCEATDQVVISVGTCVGIDEQTNDALSIYPNPSRGELTIKTSQKSQVQMFNSIGQEVYTFELNELNNHSYHLKELASGIYFFAVKTGGKNSIAKIIVD